MIGYPYQVEDKKKEKIAVLNEMYGMSGKIKEVVDEGDDHYLVSYAIDTTEG